MTQNPNQRLGQLNESQELIEEEQSSSLKVGKKDF